MRADPDPRPPTVTGREAEVEIVVAAVRAGAVVRISGVAGVGKSSVAAQATSELEPDHPDGLIRVAFAPDAGVDAVTVVARAAGLPLATPRDDELAAALAGKRILFLLEDTDRADLRELAAVVRRVPGCGLIATSRGEVHLPDAVVVSLDPLRVPPATADLDLVRRNPAAQVFVQVAERSDPHFELNEANASHVASICRSVGGLPLALELAASRTRLLGVEVLAGQLAHSGSPIRLLSREGGAAAAISWSNGQLTAGARSVLRWLSVFAGPFSLAAAATVYPEEEGALVEHLSQLVDLRLLAHDTEQPGAPRSRRERPRELGDVTFTMSSLVREFARDELSESGDASAARRRHAEFHADLARRAVSDIDAARDSLPDERLRRAHPDLLVAEDWYVSQNRPSAALRIAVDRAALGGRLVDPLELVGHLQDLLAQCGSDPVPMQVRCDTMLRMAQLRFESPESVDAVGAARSAWDEGTALARALDDPLRLIRAMRIITLALPVTQDFEASEAAAREGCRVAEEIGHVRWLARFEGLLGVIHHQRLEYDAAIECGTRALGRAVRIGDRRALITVGVLFHLMPAEVRPSTPLLPGLADLYRFAREMGDLAAEEMLLASLADRARVAGDVGASAYWILRRLETLPVDNAWRGIGYSAIALAHIAHRHGDDAVAAWFHGIVLSRMPLLLNGTAPSSAARYEPMIREVQESLGEEAFATQVRAGSILRWSEIVGQARAYAERLAVPPPGAEAAPAPAVAVPMPRTAAETPTVHDVLTPRERQVLVLIVEGLTNTQIAARLGVSAKTVMHQSGSIYRKLDVRSRAEAAATAVRAGLLD